MGSTVHGILQARILEWVAFPFSRGSSQPGIEPGSPTLQVDSLPAEPQEKPKNTGVGSLFLLQQIFLTQELNQGLLHLVLATWEKQGSVVIVQSLSPVHSLWPQGLQCPRLPCLSLSPRARLPCPSLSHRVCSNLCPLHQRCYLTISSSATPFSFCLQSFPASGSFPMSQFFALGGQSIGASASATDLPMNIQDRSPLERTGWISLQSKGLSGVFPSTTVQKHRFFLTQPLDSASS